MGTTTTEVPNTNAEAENALRHKDAAELECLRNLREIASILNMNADTRKMFLGIVCYVENWDMADPEAVDYANDLLGRASKAIKDFDRAHDRFLEALKKQSKE